MDLADAFALGTLDELEQHACARHLARTVHHHGCREALAAAQGVVDSLAAALPGSMPPLGLWRRSRRAWASEPVQATPNGCDWKVSSTSVCRRRRTSTRPSNELIAQATR